MKVLVTGGAGFIGSHLVDELVKRRHSVTVLDNLSHGHQDNISVSRTKYKFVKADIKDNLNTTFKRSQPEVVFHLAAQIDLRKSLQDPAADADINILGSINILEACVKYNVKKLIFTSTGGAIYGPTKIIPTPETHIAQPSSPYGIAKHAVEHYLRYYKLVHGLQSTVLRFSNVYGPRQNPHGEAGVIAIFAGKLKQGKSPSINGSGNQTRDYVYVMDVVGALIKALDKNTEGIFNIATGQETSVNEIFSELVRLTKFKGRANHVPEITGEIKRSVLDAGRAKKILNWEPRVDIRKGLAMVIKHLRTYA